MMDFSIPADRLSDAELAIMEAEAQTFLYAGGVILWSDWQRMADAGRAAFLCASKRLRAENATLTARAAESREGWLEVLAQTDDGSIAAEITLMDLAARVAERRRTGPALR
jgi:hypothetical protein